MSVNSPKVELEEGVIEDQPLTPSEKIVKGKSFVFENEVVDDEGHVYKLRVPTPLDELDFAAALGKDNCLNQVVFGMAMPLMFIESIDGKAYRLPDSFLEIRADVKLLGRAGMNALTPHVLKYQSSLSLSAEDLSNAKK